MDDSTRDAYLEYALSDKENTDNSKNIKKNLQKTRKRTQVEIEKVEETTIDEDFVEYGEM